MTQNKVSDCHGAEMDSHYSSDEEGSNDFYSCRKCGRNCSPVEAKKLDVETFLAESEEAGAALKRKDAQPPEDREFVGEGKKCDYGNHDWREVQDGRRCVKCKLEQLFTPRPTEGWEKQVRGSIVTAALNPGNVEVITETAIALIDFIAAELAKKDEEISRKNTEIANWKSAKEELQRNQEGELAKAREEGKNDVSKVYETMDSRREEIRASYRAELREKIEKMDKEDFYCQECESDEVKTCPCLKKVLSLLAEPNNEKK